MKRENAGGGRARSAKEAPRLDAVTFIRFESSGKITSIETSDRRSWRPLADYTRESREIFSLWHHDSPLDGGMLTDARKYSRSSIADLPATEKEVNSHSRRIPCWKNIVGYFQRCSASLSNVKQTTYKYTVLRNTSSSFLYFLFFSSDHRQSSWEAIRSQLMDPIEC